MAGGTKAGSLDPNEVMRVTLVVRPRASGPKQEFLDKLIASGERLSREEYEARYGADPGDVQQVEAFAAAHALAVAQVNLAARTVTLTGIVWNRDTKWKFRFAPFPGIEEVPGHSVRRCTTL